MLTIHAPNRRVKSARESATGCFECYSVTVGTSPKPSQYGRGAEKYNTHPWFHAQTGNVWEPNGDAQAPPAAHSKPQYFTSYD